MVRLVKYIKARRQRVKPPAAQPAPSGPPKAESRAGNARAEQRPALRNADQHQGAYRAAAPRRVHRREDGLPSSGDPKLWLALLHEVEYAGGEAATADLRQRLRRYFPALDDTAPLAGAAFSLESWHNCVGWARIHLIRRGCLWAETHGVVRLTKLGAQWLRATWRGPEYDYSDVDKPAEPDEPAATGHRTQSPGVPALRQTRRPDEARLHGRLIAQALSGGGKAKPDVVDYYLLGMIAHELGRCDQAEQLLGLAIDAGLEQRFSTKAQQFRERCRSTILLQGPAT